MDRRTDGSAVDVNIEYMCIVCVILQIPELPLPAMLKYFCSWSSKNYLIDGEKEISCRCN